MAEQTPRPGLPAWSPSPTANREGNWPWDFASFCVFFFSFLPLHTKVYFSDAGGSLSPEPLPCLLKGLGIERNCFAILSVKTHRDRRMNFERLSCVRVILAPGCFAAGVLSCWGPSTRLSSTVKRKRPPVKLRRVHVDELSWQGLDLVGGQAGQSDLDLQHSGGSLRIFCVNHTLLQLESTLIY